MVMDRRQFMSAAAASGAVLVLPRLGPPDRRRTAARTLVLIHLEGGNDGLNTVIPYTDPRYRTLRPALAIDTGAVRKVSDTLGLHPSLQGFENLLRRERLAIVNGVGYPEPSYSHFRATEIWYTAEPERSPDSGWIARLLLERASERPVRAIAVAREEPMTLLGAGPGTLTMTDFDRLRLPTKAADAVALYERFAGLDATRGAVGRAGTDALATAERIARLRPATGSFYGRVGGELRKVLALLEADLELDCVQISQGGYDTHANQTGQHNNLLAELGNNLDAFQRQLDDKGLAERVVTMVFSEFGRRASENLSGGTDHGSAGPVFVIGKGVHAGCHGAQPSLDDLDADNLRHTTDFRCVYAALLRDALQVDPAPIVGTHEPLELFA